MSKKNFLIESLIIYYSDLIKFVENKLRFYALHEGIISYNVGIYELINEYTDTHNDDKKEYSSNNTGRLLEYFFNKKNIETEYNSIEGTIFFKWL